MTLNKKWFKNLFVLFLAVVMLEFLAGAIVQKARAQEEGLELRAYIAEGANRHEGFDNLAQSKFAVGDFYEPNVEYVALNSASR